MAQRASHSPQRHEAPLTAAQLHTHMEKEQEAVVNRLTRELAALRQQTASVVSNASSTSTGLLEPSEHGSTYGSSAIPHPTSSRRHRSSSSLSSRGGFATAPSGIADRPASSGIAPPRDTVMPHAVNSHRSIVGRHDSTASSMVTNAGSYAMGSGSNYQGDHMPGIHQHSMSTPSQATASPTSIRSSIIGGGSRVEEVSQYKAELESVKRENEVLRHRIRELEGLKVRRRASATPTGQNTNAPGSLGDQEDDIKVGESAGSKGLRSDSAI